MSFEGKRAKPVGPAVIAAFLWLPEDIPEPGSAAAETHVPPHGDTRDAQGPVALPLQPVQQGGRLQDEGPAHDEQVRHVTQTGATGWTVTQRAEGTVGVGRPPAERSQKTHTQRIRRLCDSTAFFFKAHV